MSLSERIRAIAYGDQITDKSQSVPCVPSEEIYREQLQAPSHAVVPPVPSVPCKNTRGAEEQAAQNDDNDLRMAWLVLIDGKPARVVGSKKRSYIEVMRSIQARWPGYDIEVVK